MKKLGEVIFTSAWEDKVHAVLLKEKTGQRVSVDLYIEDKAGELSDIVTLTRKDVITKKNYCDFLYDFGCGFSRDDIDVIKNKILHMVNDVDKAGVVQTRVTLTELHQAISDYIRDNSEELKDNAEAEVFIKESFGYMITSKMDEFVNDNKKLGYKRLEVLKRLKIMGALQTGKGRPYDILVSVGGEKKRFYKIELAKKVKEEKEDEVIVL